MAATPSRFPIPIRATLDDLPAPAAAAISHARALPESGARIRLPTSLGPLSALAWGPLDGPAVLLLHGVTSSARTWWRVGPALAAMGWRVFAADLPGHGRTGGGADGLGFGFAETAAVVAEAVLGVLGSRRAAGATVVGHSWGAMLAAHLPSVGRLPAAGRAVPTPTTVPLARIVLLDPPVMDAVACRTMAEDPDSRPEPSLERALATIEALRPDWGAGDRLVKAEALTQLSGTAAAAVLLGNGDWDGGLAALGDAAATTVSTWIVRGEDATGSLTPSSWLPRFERLIGPDHILTVAEGEHSPQRQRIEATTVALLRALGDAP